MADKKFDLKKRAATPPRAPRASGGAAGGAGAAAKTHPRKLYTAEDQLELLRTYVHVPRDFWPELKPGAHVRYYVKQRPDGALGTGPDPEVFRIGGYIRTNPYTWKPKNSPREKRGILFSVSLGYNQGSKKAPAWTAAYDDIRDVYVRSDPSALLVRMELARVVDQLNSNIIQLSEKVRQMDRRLQLVEGGRRGGDDRGRDDRRHGDGSGAHRHRSKSRHSRDSRHGGDT